MSQVKVVVGGEVALGFKGKYIYVRCIYIDVNTSMSGIRSYQRVAIPEGTIKLLPSWAVTS